MVSFTKFLFFFLLYGIVWFFVYSIPVSKNQNIFIFLQKEFKVSPEEEDKGPVKKAIDKDKVIDALTKAFENK